MIPKYAFSLTTFGRDQKVHVLHFETLATAMAAVQSLKPALIRNYELSVIIAAGALQDTSRSLHGFQHSANVPVQIVNRKVLP